MSIYIFHSFNVEFKIINSIRIACIEYRYLYLPVLYSPSSFNMRLWNCTFDVSEHSEVDLCIKGNPPRKSC